MIIELKKTLSMLEKLNDQLRARILKKKQIIDEENYISDLPEIQLEMNKLIDSLDGADLKDPDKVLEQLVYLHVKFGSLESRIELVHDMIKTMIAHYEDLQPKRKN